MNLTRMRLLVLLFVPALLARPVLGEEDTPRTLSPYFVVQGGEAATDAFPLKSTHVAVSVSGVIADVLVTQTYANEGTEPLHARYVFPASTRASVHGMRIRIGDQVVVAKIQERRRARTEFETARAEGRSATLLEQQRANVFTMSVANIMPRDRVEVELHYTELLIPTDGIYELVTPGVVGPRYAHRREGVPTAGREPGVPYQPTGSAPPSTFDISVTLSAGMHLQDITSPSHPVDVAWDTGDVATVRLADGAPFGGDRDFILRYRLAGDQIQSGLLLHQGETENFFLLMVQPPERFRPGQIPPREYVFILDVSGSMDGFPLDTAKLLVSDLIRSLRPVDRFNVLLFAGGSRVMAPESLPATEESIATALRVIETQRGGGGTELIPALNRALSLPRQEGFSRSVVVITDGYVDADREVFELVRRNLGQTNFFSFGIGTSVNRLLVEGIARAGLGEPFVVTGAADAREAADRFRAYIESPLLTGIRVACSGLEIYDVEPPALPDLFAQRPIILFGKWRGRPAGEIQVSGDTVAGEYRHTVRFTGAGAPGANGALRYLWARERVARLSDFGFGRTDPAVESEVTALGLGYSLLTKNTSFVAVLEDLRNARGEARDVDQPLPSPLGVSALAIGGEYASGAEPGMWILIGLALAAASLHRMLR